VDEPALELRTRTLARLAEQQFDLLVIGGGIIGAGTAAVAAQHGLRVALVDRRDFGGATSSASSKLVHGGLRYLRLGDVGLVREAHQERRILMRIVAPHLVRRQLFLFPLYSGGPYRPFAVQSGIVLYQALAGARLTRLLDAAAARRLVPDLRLEGLRACGLYADAVTHDTRLTLANVRAAADGGAAVLNYAEVVALRTHRGRVDGAEVEADGERVEVRARAVVNAAGPWVDSVRRLEDERAGRSVRLSKGVHVLVALDRPWEAALTIPHDKVRVSFAVPWEGMLLLGTTDTLYDRDADDVRVDDDDVVQVLGEAAVALDGARFDVRHTFAGLRVLPGGGGSTARARRETVFSRGPGGMLSVAGGKLTTYRRIALAALGHLRTDVGLHKLDRRPRPLPGASGMEATRLPDVLEPATRSHLLHLYGSLARDVLAPAADDPALLEPLGEGAPDVRAQALYAATHEWARTVDDVTLRRTTLEIRGTADDEARTAIHALLEAHASRGGVR
jgi:glycerol-3-phosphate dehydrogenase